MFTFKWSPEVGEGVSMESLSTSNIINNHCRTCFILKKKEYQNKFVEKCLDYDFVAVTSVRCVRHPAPKVEKQRFGRLFSKILFRVRLALVWHSRRSVHRTYTTPPEEGR